MKKTVFVLGAVCLILAFAGCASYSYVPVKDDQIMVIADRGMDVAVLEDDMMRITVRAADEKQFIKFLIEFKNKTDDVIRIEENCAVIKQGNYPDDMIPAKITFTATEFIKHEADAAVAMACCLAMGSAATTASAIRHPSSSNRLDAHIANENMREYTQDTEAYLQYLKNSLLFESDILSGGEYAGLIYGILWKPGSDSVVKTNPTMVSITIHVNDKEYIFMFNRNEN
ncbi:MAG: hypothetical protein JW904_00300 [Spirochaetales bacterium]|nr:hypothetical protein [Spirochaetales bacterium]